MGGMTRRREALYSFPVDSDRACCDVCEEGRVTHTQRQ